MWKIIRLTLLGTILVIINVYGISGSEDSNKILVYPEMTQFIPLAKEQHNITVLETEPGFNYTEAEMKKLKIWPGGVVPYYIDRVSFGTEFRRILNDLLQTVSKIFGVQFLELQRPPSPQKTSRWVLFLNRRGAVRSEEYATKDFTTHGVQDRDVWKNMGDAQQWDDNVVLGTNSPHNGQLHSIILAILGVPPQHNAPNRDKFITVHYDNIIPDKKHLFDKLKNDEWLFHDLKYDYLSAGHYGLHKHSIGGFATIETLFEVGDNIGGDGGFSSMDIQKVRMLYNYISKTRSKLIKKSDCSKMFQPGPKIKDTTIQPLWQTPRPKPKQYLGVTDDTNDNNNLGSKEDKMRWKLKKKSKKGKRKPNRPTTRRSKGTTTTKIYEPKISIGDVSIQVNTGTKETDEK